MARIKSCCLFVLVPLLLLGWTSPPSAYPPPPGSRATPSSEQEEWTPETGPDLQHATRLYFRGVEAYLEGDHDLAGSYLESALETLESLQIDRQRGTEEGTLLRRKAAYLLGKVSRNGEYEIPCTEWERQSLPPPEQTGQLPGLEILRNDKTDRWIRYFSEDARDRFSTYLARSGRYEAVMRNTLRAQGIPEDLVYLPLIESGFNPKAYSTAHASGVWQFISSTGSRYGLRIDYWVDERRDPEKSCDAAARHLRCLWEIFESWPLALAAYNAGEKRVMDAILSRGTRDFWSLRLPRQTRDYVPRYMAGVIIAKDPQTHGFDPAYEPPLAYEVLEVDQSTDLQLIARCCGSTEEVLKGLNPHLRRACTPPGEQYSVKIPMGSLDICRANLFKIPKDERLAQQPQFTHHRVRRGETLSHIAARYGTTVSQIVSANNLTNRHLIREGQKLTIPTAAYHSSSQTPESGGWNENGEKIVYVVKRGDTLDAIARAHNTRVELLRSWNGLGRNQHLIHPGDRLLVFIRGRS